MDLKAIRCDVTARIHTADDRIFEYSIELYAREARDLLKLFSRYLLLKWDHVFFFS